MSVQTKENPRQNPANAVILAAGANSHFVPLFDQPKALLMVRGEVLIERLLRQLRQAGVRDITVVVGFHPEKFSYLREKYGVALCESPRYFKENNAASLLTAADRLGGTWVLTADVYYRENPFVSRRETSFHTRLFCDSENEPVLKGFGYLFPKAAALLKERLESSRHTEGFDDKSWTDFLPELSLETEIAWEPLEASRCRVIDSYETLRREDAAYLDNAEFPALRNICGYFGCRPSELSGFCAMKSGLTNTSFRFEYRGTAYVYRHPGKGTEAYISRKSEAFALKTAGELGIDDTLVYMDPHTGWKLSRFVFDCDVLDYHAPEQVKAAMKLIRRLHDARIQSPWNFDLWKNTEDFLGKVACEGGRFCDDFEELTGLARELARRADADGFPRCLCHCDFYNPNLIHDSKRMYLIDWEYAGNSDPASDLGTFICCSDYTVEEALAVLELYKGRPLTPEETRHDVAYIALASFYWFVWAVYQETVDNPVGEYLNIWHDYARSYGEMAAALYGLSQKALSGSASA